MTTTTTTTWVLTLWGCRAETERTRELEKASVTDKQRRYANWHIWSGAGKKVYLNWISQLRRVFKQTQTGWLTECVCVCVHVCVLPVVCSSSFCIPYWELLVPLLPLLSTAAKFKSRSCLAGGGDGGLRWSQALKEGKHACQTCTTRIGLGALQHYNFSLAVTHFFPPSFSLLLLCWPSSSSSSSNHLKHFGACT